MDSPKGIEDENISELDKNIRAAHFDAATKAVGVARQRSPETITGFPRESATSRRSDCGSAAVVASLPAWLANALLGIEKRYAVWKYFGSGPEWLSHRV